MLLGLVNISTGLRIASQTRTELLWLGALLPQGLVHRWHVLSALILTSLVVVVAGLWIARRFSISRKASIQPGYMAVIAACLSGWMVYTGLLNSNWHWYCAVLLIAFILFHSAEQTMRYGRRVVRLLLIPGSLKVGALFLATGVSLLAAGTFWLVKSSPYALRVHSLTEQDVIDVDGLQEESFWEGISPLRVRTYGGDNFSNGESEVTVKAARNSWEIYLFVQWRDSTESLRHLPLIKADEGWQVRQEGFERFDEKQYYEDKFAIMLSEGCGPAADNTAHLGHKPLADKPANWHQKGYHYSTDGSLKDLWHWKAVRSNFMWQADDGFFGPHAYHSPGARRYTAGYQYDSKSSGGLAMNWDWFTPAEITPRRLPTENINYTQGYFTWFDAKPYNVDRDREIPVGTVLPSVIYTSNQIEGDRGDVRAHGKWADGIWSLELARKLTTGSEYDVPVESGNCLWVSAFDHSQTGHTRHARPISLVFE